MKRAGGFKGIKGLLVKDFKFFLQNKTLLGVLLMIEAVFFAMQGISGATFVMIYMMMGTGMLVLSTITMDEYDKNMAFLMTMPVSRKDYVLEKYVLSLLCVLFGWVMALLPCLLLKPDGMGKLLAQSLGILAVMVLLQMLALPAQLKFGGERGRVVLACICAVAALAVVFAKKAGGRYMGPERMQTWAGRIGEAVYKMDMAETGCIAAVICVVCFAVSFWISKGIMEKKEF